LLLLLLEIVLSQVCVCSYNSPFSSWFNNQKIGEVKIHMPLMEMAMLKEHDGLLEDCLYKTPRENKGLGIRW
jgi:hypothetical protein